MNNNAMVSQKEAIQVTELPEGSHIKLGPKIEKSASHTPQLQMMAKNFLRNKQAVPHMSSGHTAIGPVSA